MPLSNSSPMLRSLLLPLLLSICLLPSLQNASNPPPSADVGAQQPKKATKTPTSGRKGVPPPPAGNRMCPLNEHVVCNEMNKQHAVRCVCTMFGSGSPAPEQSCSNLLNSSASVEATSVKLRLSNSFFPPAAPSNTSNATSNSADNFLEEKFKAQLAWHFKINQKNILFLRLRCQEDENVIVQFVVLRRNRKQLPPYTAKEDLIDADTVVRRIKGMRESQRIGGLEIMHVEKVTELVPVEVDIDNSRLVTQAIAVGTFMLITCLCGCWISCRRRRPEDEGYEDVVQRPEKV